MWPPGPSCIQIRNIIKNEGSRGGDLDLEEDGSHGEHGVLGISQVDVTVALLHGLEGDGRGGNEVVAVDVLVLFFFFFFFGFQSAYRA